MPAAIRSRFTFRPTRRRTSFDMSLVGQDVQLIATHYSTRRGARALGPKYQKAPVTPSCRRPGKNHTHQMKEVLFDGYFQLGSRRETETHRMPPSSRKFP